MKDGLYRVKTSYLCAGFVVKNGMVVESAPILRNKMTYWKTIAEEVEQPITSFRGDYIFLSNFYPSEIMVNGIIFPTVEHAYHAAKTDDIGIKKSISQAKSPGAAKKMGHHLQIRPNWNSIRVLIMEDLLRRKFSIPELRNKLIETGNRELIEGNEWHDAFWGVCDGVGSNYLGKLLMKIRDEFNDNTNRTSAS